MKALKYLSYVGKLAGFVAALDTLPFIDPAIGVAIFAAASLLKDTVNRIGDLLDDGKVNQSFKA
jgi:hypothetical protein